MVKQAFAWLGLRPDAAPIQRIAIAVTNNLRGGDTVARRPEVCQRIVLPNRRALCSAAHAQHALAISERADTQQQHEANE